MATPRFSGATGALGSIEGRLRRALQLAGLIEAAFEPVAIPTVVVDDATRPGCNEFSNRRWQAFQALGVAAATTASVTWRAVQPVVIDALVISVEAANPLDANGGSVQMRFLEPTLADPYALAPATAASGNFVENFTNANDRPGFLVGNAAAAVATGTVVGSLFFERTFRLPVQWFLPIGGKLALNVAHNGAAAAHQIQVILQGRMF